jgi:YD repeat-containing protein
MSETFASGFNFEAQLVAIKPANSISGGVTRNTYSYAGTGYANPHAVTQIGNGQSTSTFSYDNDGNLIQKTTDGTTTTYVWDYANRLIALGVSGDRVCHSKRPYP